MTNPEERPLTHADLDALSTPADDYAALGASQMIINELVENARLVLEDAKEGHKRVIVCAVRTCGCCIRVEACNSHVLVCKKSRLLEIAEDGSLHRVFGANNSPEPYDGPMQLDGRGWGTELTPRRKPDAS